MFKVNLALPSEVVREDPVVGSNKKKKKKSESQTPRTGNDLQKMLDSIKEPEPGSESTELKQKPKKNKKVESKQTKQDTLDTKEGRQDTKQVKQDKKANQVNATQDKQEKNANQDKQDDKAEESGRTAPLKRKAEVAAPSTTTKKQLTPLQLKMQQKLSGARFRWINEQLYTKDSHEAFEIFQKQPEVFKEYHDGFRHQVEQWPENPVLSFVQQFKDRSEKPLNAPGGLPGDKAGGNKVVVADMGCGEAELALQLTTTNNKKQWRRKPQFEVHSFDLTAANDRITVADIANVPLPNESCHVVVYCLALMGTNLADFINEGIRILKPNGLVWIAEIKSRFESGEYSEFVETLKNMGLYHRTTDDSNKMFVKFEFVKLPHKLARAKDTHPEISLKPCIYKRR